MMLTRSKICPIIVVVLVLAGTNLSLAQASSLPDRDEDEPDQLMAIVAAQRTVYAGLFKDEYTWPTDAILSIDVDLSEEPLGAVGIGMNSTGEQFIIEVLSRIDVAPVVSHHATGGVDPGATRAALLCARLSSSAGAVVVLGTFLSYELHGLTRVNKLIVTRTLSAPASPSAQAQDKSALGLIGGALAGAVVCYNTTQLCIADALTAHGDCVRGCETQLSDPGQRNECLDCCQTRFDQDLLNCMLSCGANGPDGDYHYCWELVQ